MENPIAVYQFSLERQIRTFTILLVMTVVFFSWWLDIRNPIVFLTPMGFMVLIVSLHWLYAWSNKDKTAIKIYKSGLHLENEFVHWSEIKSVDLKRTDINVFSYSLVVYKRDGNKLESNLDFLNEKSDVVFRSVRNAFEIYS